MLERLSTPLESPKKYPTLAEAQNHQNSSLFQLEFSIEVDGHRFKEIIALKCIPGMVSPMAVDSVYQSVLNK